MPEMSPYRDPHRAIVPQVHSNTTPAEMSAPFRQVADVLTEAMREARIPGAALGIVSDGREEHATFGVASLASLQPVTARTRFQIASISKTYTATAAWRLIEQGLLDLDAPVRRYLPGLRLRDEDAAAAVTVRNLLEHTAGWAGDQVIDDGVDDENQLSRYVTEQLPDTPQLFPCGDFFSYSNSGFQLLGRVVEVVAGESFSAALSRLVFTPLGAHASTFDRTTVLGGRYCEAHTAMPVNGRDAVLIQTPVWLPRSIDPAGGIWSTTRDLIGYARAHWGESLDTTSAPLLKPATLALMQAPAVPVPGLGLHMGRSWFVEEVDGHRLISHDGDTFGQHAVLALVPESRFAFVVLLNGQPGAQVALAALDAALCGTSGLGALAGRVGLMRSVFSPPEAETYELPADQSRAYEGRYVDPGQTTTVRMVGETLQRTVELTPAPGAWQPPFAEPPAAPAAVRFLGPDLAAINGWRIPFVRNAAGEVGWIAEGLRMRPRV